MTKEVKIKEAYGENWDQVKQFADENGWIKDAWIYHGVSNGISYDGLILPLESSDVQFKQYNSSDSTWRLKILIGIENNNGWTKIENDSDLPDIHDVRMFMPCEFGKPRPDYSINAITIRNGFQSGVITHWRLIEMIPNPIF